jgi:hypothetical protein
MHEHRRPRGRQRNGHTVTAVLIAAEPESGKACLIGVTTDPQNPDSGATVLFPK